MWPLKHQIVTKLKNAKYDNSQNFKLWQNYKTEMVTKLKNLNLDKTQIVTKLKNSNCDKTQKLKLWQNPKIQVLTKLKNSNCDTTKNSNCDNTKKNQKNLIVTKLDGINSDGSNSDIYKK